MLVGPEGEIECRIPQASERLEHTDLEYLLSWSTRGNLSLDGKLLDISIILMDQSEPDL